MELKEGFKKTEVGFIPEDWEVKRLGQLAKVVGGGTPKTTISEFWNGNISWFTPTEVGYNKYLYASKRKVTLEGLQNSSAQILPVGSILLTSRAGIGDLGILRSEAATNQGFQSLIVFEENDNEFVYYLLSTLKPQLLSKASGSTFLEISPSKVKEVNTGFPPTLTEQKAIAQVLSDTDELIEALQKKIAKKKLIKKGVMQRLLTPNEGWEVKTLGEAATLKARIGWQGLTTSEYLNSGKYILITGTDFKNGFIDWDNCFYVAYERYKQDRNIQIKKGDILVTKDGTIGKVAFIKQEHMPATLNSGVFVIRPIENSFYPEYFYYVLMSNHFTEYLTQLVAGSTITHLYQKDFVHYKFPVPPTIEEQKQIAQILSDMDSEIEQLGQKLSKYKQAKQGLMQQLLTGKIRLV